MKNQSDPKTARPGRDADAGSGIDALDNPSFPPAERAAVMIRERGETALAADRDARAVAERVGYQLPADSTEPDLICRDISANMRRSVDAVLEIGKGLLVLKAACGHGGFGQRMTALGINERLGQRFMQSALKFSKASLTTLLLPKIDSQAKLFELLVLDDEQIEELTETGRTGELALDDVACMSVSELRRALRETRRTVSAKDAVIGGSQKTISLLQERLAGRADETEIPDPAARGETVALADLEAAQAAIQRALLGLTSRLAAVREALGDGPRLAAIRHAAFLCALGAIRQAALDLDVPLAVPEAIADGIVDEIALPRTDGEVDAGIWEKMRHDPGTAYFFEGDGDTVDTGDADTGGDGDGGEGDYNDETAG